MPFSLKRHMDFQGLNLHLTCTQNCRLHNLTNFNSRFKSGELLLSRISNPATTLQSKKLIYNSLNDILKDITKRQIWRVKPNLVNIP